jgi:hypothetical protein
MREINNNKNNINFPTVGISKDTAQVPQDLPKAEEISQPQITENLSLAPGAVIGRSQVQMSVQKTNASVEADMKSMLENPNAVANAVKFFDIAYEQFKQAGDKEAYEKAAVLTHAFKEELF